MVAAGVGMTLLPELSVTSPVPPNPDLVLLRFTDPAPCREIAMFSRRTSAYRELLPEIAAILRQVPVGRVAPSS
jgi:LysR family hydrogen peroxide-inducible transcriptional activator